MAVKATRGHPIGELPLEPFRAWAERRIHMHGGIKAWSRRIGMEETNLARYIHPYINGAYQGMTLSVADKIVTRDGSALLWDIWPELAEVEPESSNGRMGCPPGRYGFMTDSEGYAAHVLYDRGGLSLRQLGALLHARSGCANGRWGRVALER